MEGCGAILWDVLYSLNQKSLHGIVSLTEKQNKINT